MTPTTRVLLWTRMLTQAVQEGLRGLDGVELVTATDEAHAIATLPGVDAALVAGLEYTYTARVAAAAREAAAAGRLRWLQLVSTGYDGLESFGVPPGVPVTGIGGAFAPVVAEQAMALLLALARRMGETVAQSHAGRWDRGFAPRLASLEGMTLCIAGFGPIGQEIARRAHAFGMRIVVVNRGGAIAPNPLVARTFAMGALNEALAEADAIALALPLTAQTRASFGAAQWAACKPGALLVNVGRGAVIDTPSLLEALASGRIGGAGLDVTDPEPLPAGHTLWSAPNVLVSPHVAGGGSAASQARMVALIRENLRRFVANEPLLDPLSI